MKLPIRQTLICLVALAAGIVCAALIRKKGEPSTYVAGMAFPNPITNPEAPAIPATLEFDTQLATYEENRSAPGAIARLNSSIFRLRREELAPALGQLLRPDLYHDHQLIGTLFSRWVELDPEGALGAAANLESGQLRSLARYAVWFNWAAIDPETAFTHLKNPLVGNYRKEVERTFWNAAATHKPLRALELAANITDEAKRTKKENEINRLQSYGDPQAALAWAHENRSPEDSVALVESIFWAWGGSETGEALRVLLTLPEIYHTDKAFANIAGGATRLSADYALELLPEIPEPHRAAFLAKVVDQEASNNNNPLAAADIANQLPPGRIRDNTYQQLVAEWVRFDAAEASKWVTNLPPSRARDRAAAAISSNQRNSDPEAATIWGAFIEDPKMRYSHTRDAYTNWREQDKESADEWFRQTDRLTKQQKEELLSGR